MQVSCNPKTFLSALFLTFIHLLVAQTEVLSNAHSHNDYRQVHPLRDALKFGFTSIEVDVYFVNNQLVVSHFYPVFKKKRTIETLYLKPLQDSSQIHLGNIYANYNAPHILLIDIKNDATKTYSLLKTCLENYKSMLTRSENGKIIPGAVTIILTGKKPPEAIENENCRFVFMDENLLNSDTTNSRNFCFMASAKYSKLLKWKGKGEISSNERQKLIRYVSFAHHQGKKIRLWGAPENKAVWQELLNCGVDLINTDKLNELHQFLLNRKP